MKHALPRAEESPHKKQKEEKDPITILRERLCEAIATGSFSSVDGVIRGTGSRQEIESVLGQPEFAPKVPHFREPGGDCVPLVMAARAGRVDLMSVLIDHGAKLGAAGPDGTTALHAACWSCSEKALSALLSAARRKLGDPEERKKIARAQNVDGWMAIHVAASKGFVSAIRAFFGRVTDGNDWEWGISPSVATARKGLTPLMIAAQGMRQQFVQKLLEFPDACKSIDAVCTKGATALVIAVQNGDRKIANTLIARCSCVNGAFGGTLPGPSADLCVTPLVCAVRNRNADMVSMLLRNGASTRATGKSEPPLIIAIREKRLDIVKLLLERCCRGDDYTMTERPVMLEAVRANSVEIVSCCIEYWKEFRRRSPGAFPGFLDVEGKRIDSAGMATALQEACGLRDSRAEIRVSKETAKRQANEVVIAKLLIDAGADIFKVCSLTPSSFRIATDSGMAGVIVHMIQKYGASAFDFCQPDRTGKTPLAAAISRGDRTMSQVLAHYGPVAINLVSQTSEKCTPLFLAIDGGHQEIAQDLLARGANPRVLNGSRCSVLAHIRKIRADTMRALIRAGVDVNYAVPAGCPMRDHRHPLELMRIPGTNAEVIELLLLAGSTGTHKVKGARGTTKWQNRVIFWGRHDEFKTFTKIKATFFLSLGLKGLLDVVGRQPFEYILKLALPPEIQPPWVWPTGTLRSRVEPEIF